MNTLHVYILLILGFVQINCAHRKVEPHVILTKKIIANPPEPQRIPLEKQQPQLSSLLTQQDLNQDHTAHTQEILDKLKHEIQINKLGFNLISDVVYVIEAQRLEQQEEFIKAQDKWFEALKITRGDLGKLCFENWVRLLLKNQDSQIQLDDLIKLILNSITNAQCCPYLQQAKLYKEDKLKIAVLRLLSSYDVELSQKVMIDNVTIMVLPPKEQYPKDDLSLIKAAKRYCRLNPEHQKLWDMWIKSFKWPVIVYWQALVAECNHQYQRALSLFITATNYLLKTKTYLVFAYYANKGAIRMYKILGQRYKMAQRYNVLKNIWIQYNLQAKDFNNIEAYEYYIQKINDFVLICSYQALVNNYVAATRTCYQGLKIISEYFAINKKISLLRYYKLISLKAELYYTLAFKVALYNQQYESSIVFASAGLQIINLSQGWKDRFKWILAFANYLKKNYTDTIYYLEDIIVKTQSQSFKAQALFWLSQAYFYMGDIVRAKEYNQKLLKEFPLSFYSVVATSLSSVESNIHWTSVFLSQNKINVDLSDKSKFDIDINETEILDTFKKSEILINMNLNYLAYYVVSDLERLIIKNFVINKYESLYVYLTRLQYLSGRHYSSIHLISQLLEQNPKFWEYWPEQIWIYFPRPYSELIQNVYKEYSVPESWFYAIARQESTFRPNVKSIAGAVGLLQIMPYVAEKIVKKNKLILKIKQDYETSLLDEELNIKIFAIYINELVHKYQNNNLPYIFGAYNAGTEAVDIWIKHNSHKPILEWIELVTFGETRKYIKKVWRNVMIYEFLMQQLKLSNTNQ